MSEDGYDVFVERIGQHVWGSDYWLASDTRLPRYILIKRSEEENE